MYCSKGFKIVLMDIYKLDPEVALSAYPMWLLSFLVFGAGFIDVCIIEGSNFNVTLDITVFPKEELNA